VTTEIVKTMKRRDAERCVEKIRWHFSKAAECLNRVGYHLGELRHRLKKLRDDRGWAALGYSSMEACMAAEFSAAESTLYGELQASGMLEEMFPEGPTLAAEFWQIPTRKLLCFKKLESIEDRREVAEELFADGKNPPLSEVQAKVEDTQEVLKILRSPTARRAEKERAAKEEAKRQQERLKQHRQKANDANHGYKTVNGAAKLCNLMDRILEDALAVSGEFKLHECAEALAAEVRKVAASARLEKNLAQLLKMTRCTWKHCGKWTRHGEEIRIIRKMGDREEANWRDGAKLLGHKVGENEKPHRLERTP
jgi:hypothetical protein